MNCEFAQNWLLQAEKLQPRTWPRKVSRHVKACVSCYEFARSLKKMEKAWLNQELPKEAAAPKTEFLRQIAKLEEPPVKQHSRWQRPARWFLAIAATLIIGVSVVGWILLMPGPTMASDVTDELIDWNTQIANAETEAKRKELLEEYEDIFRKRVQSTKMSRHERAVAERLLEAGRMLALNSDLAEEEEIISNLAEELMIRAKIAKSIGNNRESERAANGYARFLDETVAPLQTKLRVIDRLIDWNMEMANADSKKRKKLLLDNEESLRKEIQLAKLPADEKAMAEKLFEVGRRLAMEEDIAKDLALLTDVADKLLVRADTADKKGNTKDSERRGQGYNNFMEKAFNPFLDKLKAMQPPKTPPDGKKGGFDFAKQQKQFENIWKNAPQFNRPDMHKKYEEMSKQRPPGGGFPPFGQPNFGNKKTSTPSRGSPMWGGPNWGKERDRR